MITVLITAEIDEFDYPLSGLSDLLYALLDDLSDIEAKYKENVPFPITKVKKSEFGRLTASLSNAETTTPERTPDDHDLDNDRRHLHRQRD